MKYRLLKSDTIKRYRKTLYRIKALKSFGEIEKGDKGGYIEKEENLSQLGTCWVFRYGIVIGDSRVISGGEIRGGEISGGEIRGGEIRGGEIRGGEIRGGEIRGGEISGGVFKKNNFQLQGSSHFLNISRPNHITIGCEEHTFEY